jgi:hypothetical protein
MLSRSLLKAVGVVGAGGRVIPGRIASLVDSAEQLSGERLLRKSGRFASEGGVVSGCVLELGIPHLDVASAIYSRIGGMVPPVMGEAASESTVEDSMCGGQV